jgi:hypothetical protein
MTCGIFSEAEKAKYLPTTDWKRVDRRFLWGVFGTLKKDVAMKFYQDVYDAKMVSRLPKVKVQTLNIDPTWMDKLLQYEVGPSKVSLLFLLHHSSSFRQILRTLPSI